MRETIGKHRLKEKIRRKGYTKVKPKAQYCLECKVNKVKFHHYLCSDCWKRIHGVN